MEPKVGIYFFLDGEIIFDAVPTSQGEPYGEAVQHGGHLEFWEGLVPRTNAERKLKSRDYDFFPRGRVVYSRKKGTHVLYADKCLLGPRKSRILAELKKAFSLSNPEIERDEHYQCSKCNRNYCDPFPV